MKYNANKAPLSARAKSPDFLGQLFYGLMFLAFSLLAVSAAWAGIPKFPAVTYIGEVPAAEKKIVDGVINQLQNQESYYSKDAAIPTLPPLDVFVYNPTYTNIHLLELAAKYNPEIADFKKHESANWNAYINSSLYAAIKGLEPKLGKKGKSLAIQFYDMWVEGRYGLSVPNFHQFLQQNGTVDEIEQQLGEPVFMRDNAFFAVTSQFDLKDALTPASSGRAVTLNSIKDLGVIAKKLFDDEASKAKQKRMIVLLPRTTEGYDDTAIMTALDPSVWKHEDGHKLQEAKANGNPIPRLVDEAGADFTYASANNDSVIGAFFSKVSAVIAQRLAKSSDPTSLEGEQEFIDMAKAKYLRDMSNKFTIDTIKRTQDDDDPYDSGHPMRYFLWELHQNNPKDQVALERIHYEAVAELASLPSLISPKSGGILNFRRAVASLTNYLKVWMQVSSMKIKNPTLRKEDQNKVWEHAAAIVKQRSEKTLPSSVTWSDFIEALTGTKPAIQADYVLPEYFRCFYRQAQKYAPDLLDKIKAQADIAMVSDSTIIKNKSGGQDLVFTREGALSKKSAALKKLAEVVNNLDELRERLAQSGDPQAYRAYLDSLEKLQEFERTGNVERLEVAHPVTFHRDLMISLNDRLLRNKKGNFKLPRETIDVRSCWMLNNL